MHSFSSKTIDALKLHLFWHFFRKYFPYFLVFDVGEKFWSMKNNFQISSKFPFFSTTSLKLQYHTLQLPTHPLEPPHLSLSPTSPTLLMVNPITIEESNHPSISASPSFACDSSSSITHHNLSPPNPRPISPTPFIAASQ
jgi:hypothetical protein